jgi:hypothetical protein
MLVGCDADRKDSHSLTLGAAQPIDAPPASGSNTPHLAVAADGRLLLSWTQRNADSSVAIRMASWDGTRWDSTRTIAERRPFFVNWADFPMITTLGNGDLAAHWLEREASGKYAYGIRVVRSRDAGASWSAPVTPHTDALPAEHGFVSLWSEGTDRLGLVWLDGRKSAMPDSVREMTIRTANITPDGALEQEALLDARSCDCCQTGTAMARSGRVIVYRDRSPDEIRDIVIVRQAGGQWSAPTRVHADEWHYPGCPVNGPSVAAAGDTVVVAWYTAAHDTARVLLARSTDGGATFAPPVRVDDGNPIGRVAVVLDAAAEPVVVWLEQRTPDEADVLARRISGGERGAPVLIARTAKARQSGFPRLVRRGDDLIAAWTTVTPALQVHLARLALTGSTARE